MSISTSIALGKMERTILNKENDTFHLSPFNNSKAEKNFVFLVSPEMKYIECVRLLHNVNERT